MSGYPRCDACPVPAGASCRAAECRNAAICGYVAAGRPKWIAWVAGDERELIRLRREGKKRLPLGVKHPRGRR